MAWNRLAGYRGAVRTLETTPFDRRGEAEVGSVVGALFRRWLGFSVHDEGELFLTDLAVHPWFDEQQRSKLCYEIAVAFSELIDEEPAARELLSGRTFARTVHYAELRRSIPFSSKRMPSLSPSQSSLGGSSGAGHRRLLKCLSENRKDSG